MNFNKASLCLTTLVVLGGCKEDPEEKPKLSAVTVACKPKTLDVGQTSQCTASYQPVTAAAPGFEWTSSDTSKATVDSMGNVTTLSGGEVTISATAEGLTGKDTLTVSTVHNTAITANETWDAANNPHVVRGSLQVTGTLTIKEGVELRFEQDAELRVTAGALRAMGKPESPIRMVAAQSVPTKGYWRGVVLAAAGGASELNDVTLSHCGAASGKGACLSLENQAVPVLRRVTVQDSGTAGVMVADDGSAFGTESTTLKVSRSTGYAVRMGANQAGTLPASSTFTDNTLQAIELKGNVSRSQTWPNPGIPYVVNDEVGVAGDTSPTLTIPAGTELRFGAGAALITGYGGMNGGLIVEGEDTPTGRVRFTADADAASAKPGHWMGVFLRENTTSNTSISNATIEYGGLDVYDQGIGNLTVAGGASPIIKNVLVRKALTHGVVVQSSGEARTIFGPGSTNLSAHENGGYAIRVEAHRAGFLPTGGTFRDNAHDKVWIAGGNVVTTQTWTNLGIPYVINHFMAVGSTGDKPTLTLLPGTELRFGPEGGISVGAEGKPGSLYAAGIFGESLIRFVPDSLAPTSGSWRGLHFWDVSGSRLYAALVSHAGAGGVSPSTLTGNVNVYKEPTSGFVNNNYLNDSSGCGITVSNGTSITGTDDVKRNFTIVNNFSGNAGGNQCKN
jgi:hypothetical protein